MATKGKDNTVLNTCGIPEAHSFTVLSAFTMTDETTKIEHKMLLLRNPWAITTYSGAWSSEDKKWTNALIAQVPFKIDIRNSWLDGIFVVPIDTLKAGKCFNDYQVAHVRDSEGYSDNWYDAENMGSDYKDYHVVLPKVNGDLYFSVDTYYHDVVPAECVEGPFTYTSGSQQVTATMYNPIAYFALYLNNKVVVSKFYAEQF